MADRVNNGDVERAFVAFTEKAKREGFDVTHWAVVKPDSLGAFWRLFQVQARPGEATHRYNPTAYPECLGATNREAYDRLAAWSQCLDAVKLNRDNRTDTEIRS